MNPEGIMQEIDRLSNIIEQDQKENVKLLKRVETLEKAVGIGN
jgi:hypothetical protein